jgi:hypothetical protein
MAILLTGAAGLRISPSAASVVSTVAASLGTLTFTLQHKFVFTAP